MSLKKSTTTSRKTKSASKRKYQKNLVLGNQQEKMIQEARDLKTNKIMNTKRRKRRCTTLITTTKKNKTSVY